MLLTLHTAIALEHDAAQHPPPTLSPNVMPSNATIRSNIPDDVRSAAELAAVLDSMGVNRTVSKSSGS
jgi:hypothetical protein